MACSSAEDVYSGRCAMPCYDAQDTSHTSQTFSHEDLEELLQQMTGHLNVKMEHSPAKWASAIMAATNGLKGLSGAVLQEVSTVVLAQNRTLRQYTYQLVRYT